MSVDPRLLLGVFFFLLIGLLKAAYWQWRRGAYRRLLRDPRWKIRKEQYYSRHEKRCAKCGTTIGISLHHRRYIWGRKPWDYADSDLEPLCQERCHRAEHGL
jgi:ribosomal protein S27AE